MKTGYLSNMCLAQSDPNHYRCEDRKSIIAATRKVYGNSNQLSDHQASQQALLEYPNNPSWVKERVGHLDPAKVLDGAMDAAENLKTLDLIPAQEVREIVHIGNMISVAVSLQHKEFDARIAQLYGMHQKIRSLAQSYEPVGKLRHTLKIGSKHNREIAMQLKRENSDFESFKVGFSEEHKQVVLETLSKVRNFGGTITFSQSSDPRLSEMANDSLQFYPTDWINSVKPNELTIEQRPVGDMGSSSFDGGTIRVSNSNTRFIPEVAHGGSGFSEQEKMDARDSKDVVHELSHVFGSASTKILDLEHEYRRIRVEEAQGSATIKFPYPGSNNHYYPDHWADRYSGLEYTGNNRGYEILSTGMESVFKGRSGHLIGTQFGVAPDLDHRNFIFGLLVSADRK